MPRPVLDAHGTGKFAFAWLKARLRLAACLVLALFFVLAEGLPAPKASAAETSTFCYDALGRLTQVGKSGGPASGKKTSTTFDPAGNRTNQTTASGTVDCSQSGGGGAPGPSFSINDAQGTEGDTLVFTVTKTGATTSTYSVSYATAHGTANGVDYTATSGTLTFAPADVTKTISVVTKTDLKAEVTEVFYVNLSNPTNGATITDGQGVGSIFNDDSICLTCRSVSDESVADETPGDDGE